MRGYFNIPYQDDPSFTLPTISSPGLTAVGVSTSEIDVTASYVGISSPVVYTFESSSGALGPWTVLSIQASNLYKNTGLSSAQTVFYRVKVFLRDGYTTSYSTTITGTTQSSGTVSKVKFTPGHWVLFASGSGGGGIAGWSSRIAQIGAMGTFAGIVLPYDWNGLEFAEGVYTQGSGTSAQGIAQVSQLVSAATTAGLKLGIEYEDRTFFSHTYTTPTASIVNLPSYFDTVKGGSRGYYIAPSGTAPGGLGGIALEDQPTVLARHVALAKGYAAAFESNPTFEMWRGPETAIDGSAGISNSGWEANLESWNSQLRASSCWATTEFSISTNFLSNALMQQYFVSCQANRTAVGGPDNNIPWASNTGDGTTNASAVYRGAQGTVWNNVLCWISESQFPDSAGSNWHSPRTCVDVWNFWQNNISAFNPSSTFGGVQPHKYIWYDYTGSASAGIPISQISTAISNGQMPVNTQIPSSYL